MFREFTQDFRGGSPYPVCMTDPNNKGFLGGGPRFNKVGGSNSPATDSDPAAGDTGPILVPSRVSPQGSRTLIIIVLIVLLALFLFYIGENGLGGISHVQGQGGRGISPSDRPVEPPKNF